MAKRKLTAEAVIFDTNQRILLVRQGDSRRQWELPGGKVKKREALNDAIVREVHEETGLAVTPEQLLGIFYIRDENIYDFLVICRLQDPTSKPRPSPPEIIHCAFFPLDRLPTPIRPFTADRINDALNGITHPLPVEITSDQWLD
jgi:8-oxo-dGTP diphosphatase